MFDGFAYLGERSTGTMREMDLHSYDGVDRRYRHTDAFTATGLYRRPFQEKCTPSSRLLLVRYSDVNYWAVIWGTDAYLNYPGFEQG